MKISFILPLICLLTFVQDSHAQKTTDSSRSAILSTDIYSNVRQSPYPGRKLLVLKDETGSILFEDSLTNDLCPSCYAKLTNRADSLYGNRNIHSAVVLYSTAFKLNNDRGKVKHRYNAACCWTMLNNKDKAFEELGRIVTGGKYHNYYQLTTDACFVPLHNDPRWNRIVEQAQKNGKAAQDQLNRDSGF